MQYSVYYGYGTEIENKENLGTFKTIADAEKFIFQHIKQNQTSYYIRKTIVNPSFIWYDYGSHTKFYTIFGLKK